ncbi:hypothetical protein [Actinokineospora sp. NBRC 105648]|uniref:hypothetical protein n=1 Tax=Actinokineospora sp. NBRC 105648 TaxID=3032206 RepID=UPI0024A16468|nr:hypothetical protein [Actinokineospora sp. NBRC 105648]GLZ42852.1 hypothetical protein Acsp05_64760 [Actinokineospora sp. NBRC 105648]
MALTFDQIPDHEVQDRELQNRGAAPGRATALRDLGSTGRRRTVLKAITLGALTIGSSALLLGRRARAETGPNALRGWDRNDCRDAYPAGGYPEDADTSGQYVNTYAACYGGSWRGSDFCAGGWHKYGTTTEGDLQVDHMPVSTACGTTTTKNAWRWTTPDGKVFRCSDGFSTYWGAGQSGNTYLTICRAPV